MENVSCVGNVKYKKDVHTEHCSVHHCEYGEEDYCPVYLGYKPASFPEEGFSEIETLPDEVFTERRNKIKPFEE